MSWSAKELGVADSAQLRWVIVEHMMREYGQFTTEGLLEDAEKVFQYVVTGNPFVRDDRQQVER